MTMKKTKFKPQPGLVVRGNGRGWATLYEMYLVLSVESQCKVHVMKISGEICTGHEDIFAPLKELQTTYSNFDAWMSHYNRLRSNARPELVAQLQDERNKAMEFVNGHHQEVDKLRKTNAKLEAILRLYLAGQLP